MEEITVMNVAKVSTLDLALWLSTKMLDMRLPIYGINSTPDIKGDLVPLLPVIANRLAVATELYIICTGVKAGLNTSKKIGAADEKADATSKLININAHIDILYRTIQTLESQRESASRMMTGLAKEYSGGYQNHY